MPSFAPPKTSTGAVMSATETVRSPRSKVPSTRPFALQQPVVELPEGAARVRRHVRGEPVDRLDLGEVVGVVEVAGHGQGLGHEPLDRRELERPSAAAGGARPPPGGCRVSARGPSVRLSKGLAGPPEAPVARRTASRATVTDATGSSGRAGRGQQGEGAAQRPADEVDRASAGVRGHLPDGGRHDLVDPVLHPEVAVAEGDSAVLHEVRRTAALDQVLDERAASTQVVAEGRRRERRHQEHRVPRLARVRRVRLGAVVVDLAETALLDEGPGHRPQVGQPAGDHSLGEVRRRPRPPDRASGSGPRLERTPHTNEPARRRCPDPRRLS